jgi:hypothetical protein
MLGELAQIHGSERRRFEDCGGMGTLPAFVDDATSHRLDARDCRSAVGCIQVFV